MTLRTDSYRKMIYDAPYEICIERAKFYTDVYKNTEGLHPTIRAARALEKTLDNMTIYILDQENIVGNRSSKVIGVVLPIERGDMNIVIKTDLKYLKNRDFKPFQISSNDEDLLKKKILPYWKGKTVREKKIELWKKCSLFWKIDWGLMSWIRRYRQFGWKWIKEFYNRLIKGRLRYVKENNEALMANNPNLVNNVFDVQGHLIMGHKNILKWGYGGLKDIVDERLKELTTELDSNKSKETIPIKINNEIIKNTKEFKENEKTYFDLMREFQNRFSKKNGVNNDNKAFLESVMICINATIRFIKRFAKLARDKIKTEKDVTRISELERIAEICDWVATNTPRNFREAIQLTWFNHVIAMISHGIGGILAVGRTDQYLYQYYKSDIEAGLITNDEVIELLEEFLIKLSYSILMLPSYGKATASELGADGSAITVGGVDQNGDDAVNELSYLFMNAIENVKSMTNSFSIRISPEKNPQEWAQRIIEVFSKTSGPAIFNDDIIIPALQRTGVSLEDARDYAIIGCVEPSSQGNTFSCTSGNDISLVGLLEMVLTNGLIRNMGKVHGIKTGNPKNFTSYKEIWDAYLKQLNFIIDHMVKCVNIKDKIYAENYPNPFISMTLDGCLENALDMTQGGAKYNFSSISGRGLATSANSLCALKKIVFEEKSISMKELIKILNNHFKKKETFQLKLKNTIPKFGNDDDFVDFIARDIVNAFCDNVTSHSCLRTPGIFRPGFFSYGMYIIDGFFLGATPDGRNAGEPVSNSLSPSNNTERNGPTAVFKSLTKLDNLKISNGMALNMRLLPALLKTPENCLKFAELLLTYLQLGGLQVQFNVVNQKDLIDAQIHPQNHQDLVVRVSGYCAYFIDLGKPVQDDIIDRSQFC